MTELDKLVHDLGQPGVPMQLAVLLGCLALAYGVCWLAGRVRSPDSVWTSACSPSCRSGAS